MTKLFISFCLFSFLLISTNSFSQDWLPKPVESPYLNAIEGTWVSEPYQFMENTTTDRVTCTKILNGLYMEVDIQSSNDKGFNYQAKEIIKASPDGSLSGSIYDIFGKGPQPTTYTLGQDGNKLLLTVSAGNSTRDVVIDGSTMVQNVSFRMDDDLKTPEQKITITYKKQ